MIKRKTFISTIYLMILFLPNFTYAWNDTTHMLVAMIAESQLNPGVMNRIEDLGKDIDGEFPPPFDFVDAACWGCDISRYGLRALDTWYEMPMPYNPEGILQELHALVIIEQLKHNSLCFALNEALSTLNDPKAGPWEKNFMFRMLMHCVAEIHHPLHCVTLYNSTFQNGDCGGRLFAIEDSESQNLRSLWDNALKDIVQLPARFHYGTYEEREELMKMLDKIVSTYPPEYFVGSLEGSFESWAHESHLLAIQYVYKSIQPGEIPSPDYLRTRDRIVQRQVALAGYRLANLLNEIFVD